MLYPERELEKAKRQYLKEKTLLVVCVIIIGLLIGVVLKEKEKKQSPWLDGAVIRREIDGEITMNLVAKYKGETYDLPLDVTARRLTAEEVNVFYEEFKAHIWELICLENPSPDSVVGPLGLVEEYEGYPFYVEWESDCPEVMSQWGDYGGVDVPWKVVLTAHLFYEGHEKSCSQSIRVCPPSGEAYQWKKRELLQMLEDSQHDAVEEAKWQLPLEWKGEEISWAPKKSYIGWKVAVCCVALGVLLGFAKERDLGEKVKRRRRELRDTYPGLLHQLILYIGAGMTIRGSLERVVAEHEKSKKINPVFEEIRQMLRKLQAGVPEGRVYETMGRQVGVQEYMKLGTLLSQNLKHGNKHLLDRLREEGDRAWEERLLEIRKKGEEAGTKLIVPMVLLLAVILIMIIMPAFWKM